MIPFGNSSGASSLSSQPPVLKLGQLRWNSLCTLQQDIGGAEGLTFDPASGLGPVSWAAAADGIPLLAVSSMFFICSVAF